MSCQMAGSKSWNIFHSDLKTAFLQGQSYGVNRDVVCQLPPEAGHLLFLPYGMVWFRHELSDVVMCCIQPKHVTEIGTKRALHRSTALMTSYLNRALAIKRRCSI